MYCISKHKSKDISARLNGNYGLICFASFEERCLTVPREVETCAVSDVYILVNTECEYAQTNIGNAKKIKEKFIDSKIVEVDIGKPISIADSIVDIIARMRDNGVKNLLIDISTFTHEALLIMLKLVHENKSFDSVKYLYNGASAYSIGDTPEQVWLSKGCKDVRNVIGYPGVMNPALKNHVIVLAGFEIERATRLVELLEPDYLSIGDGIEPTDKNHEVSMKYFRDKFEVWINNFQNAITNAFNFSCCDLEKTVQLLSGIIENEKERNYILVPLNTKLSTLAIGLVALKYPTVQVCYAVPEMYNILGYSSPSDNITLVEL